ncbi:MAG: two-component system regulatory protein YycI [Acetivibrionales bacterium]|jgi:regulatory protein YycI of two-component signal transduction system YycFG
MDWSKAKSILIAVFLVLNIALLAGIISSRLDRGVSAEALSSTVKILEGKGIVLECEIPVYNSNTPILEYQSNKLNRSLISERLFGGDYESSAKTEKGEVQVKDSKTLHFENHDKFMFTDVNPDNPIDMSDRKKVESQLRRFMEGIGHNMSSYILDFYKEQEDGSVRVRFTEKYRRFLVFDNYVEIEASSKGIDYIECKYKEVKGFLNEEAIVMPAYQVLLKNFMESKGTVITAIDIGFKGFESDRDMKQSSEGPAWRVTLKGEDPLYFRTSDGKPIK